MSQSVHEPGPLCHLYDSEALCEGLVALCLLQAGQLFICNRYENLPGNPARTSRHGQKMGVDYPGRRHVSHEPYDDARRAFGSSNPRTERSQSRNESSAKRHLSTRMKRERCGDGTSSLSQESTARRRDNIIHRLGP